MHMFLYPGHKRMCLYHVDSYQSVTKSLRSKITMIPLIFSQITVGQARFLLKQYFWLRDVSKILNIEQIYSNYWNVRDFKFTHFVLLWQFIKPEKVSNIPFITMVKHKHMCLYPSLFHDEKLQNFNCPFCKHMCLYSG